MARLLAWVLVSLLLATGLAGCLGASDDPGSSTAPNNVSEPGGNATGAATGNGSSEAATAEPNATTPRRIRYSGCTLLQAIFAAPGPVTPQTPDGFTPAAPGYPGLMGAAGTIVVDGHVCEDATAGQRTLQDVTELHMYVLVDPPDRFESGQIDSYAVALGGVAGDATLHDLYRSWNLSEVEQGTVETTITRAGPAAEQGQVTVDSGDVTAQLLTATEGQGSGLPAYSARTFSLEDGEVASVVDIGVEPGNQTTGAAKLAVTDPPTSTGSPVLMAALNGLGTGLVSHQTMDRTWTHRDPAAFW